MVALLGFSLTSVCLLLITPVLAPGKELFALCQLSLVLFCCISFCVLTLQKQVSKQSHLRSGGNSSASFAAWVLLSYQYASPQVETLAKMILPSAHLSHYFCAITVSASAQALVSKLTLLKIISLLTNCATLIPFNQYFVSFHLREVHKNVNIPWAECSSVLKFPL